VRQQQFVVGLGDPTKCDWIRLEAGLRVRSNLSARLEGEPPLRRVSA
jgi:hypothetical protein